MAKSPVAGQVKTRLCPPCTPVEAANLAAAALADTLESAIASGAERCVLALDGEPGPWIPSEFEVIAQEGPTFGHRLDHAWAAVGGPGVQVGMDTPQVTGSVLAAALERLRTGAECLLGPALDGGWWAIGLQSAPPALFAPVPMSRPDTGQAQRRRCEALGLSVQALAPQRDVDTIHDAIAVAEAAPSTRFAAAVVELKLERREVHVA